MVCGPVGLFYSIPRHPFPIAPMFAAGSIRSKPCLICNSFYSTYCLHSHLMGGRCLLQRRRSRKKRRGGGYTIRPGRIIALPKPDPMQTRDGMHLERHGPKAGIYIRELRPRKEMGDFSLPLSIRRSIVMGLLDPLFRIPFFPSSFPPEITAEFPWLSSPSDDDGIIPRYTCSPFPSLLSLVKTKNTFGPSFSNFSFLLLIHVTWPDDNPTGLLHDRAHDRDLTWLSHLLLYLPPHFCCCRANSWSRNRMEPLGITFKISRIELNSDIFWLRHGARSWNRCRSLWFRLLKPAGIPTESESHFCRIDTPLFCCNAKRPGSSSDSWSDSVFCLYCLYCMNVGLLGQILSYSILFNRCYSTKMNLRRDRTRSMFGTRFLCRSRAEINKVVGGKIKWDDHEFKIWVR